MPLTDEQLLAARQDTVHSLMAEIRVALILYGIKVNIEGSNKGRGQRITYSSYHKDRTIVAVEYEISTGTLIWREGGTTKDQDALIRVHASTYGDNRGPIFNKVMEEGMFVIVREDGMFVAQSGSERSYTNNLMEAKTFAARRQAADELCVDNERIVTVSELLQKPK